MNMKNIKLSDIYVTFGQNRLQANVIYMIYV